MNDLHDGVGADAQVRTHLVEHLQQAENLLILGDPLGQDLTVRTTVSTCWLTPPATSPDARMRARASAISL
jgi:hypothetical protein